MFDVYPTRPYVPNCPTVPANGDILRQTEARALWDTCGGQRCHERHAGPAPEIVIGRCALERGGARDCGAEHGQRDVVTGMESAVAAQGRPEMEDDLGVRVFGDEQADVVTELGRSPRSSARVTSET